MKRKAVEEIDGFVCSWAMAQGRGYGMGGFEIVRTAPGLYMAGLELHRYCGDEKPAKTLCPATGTTRERAYRACLAKCLRAMADELDGGAIVEMRDGAP